MVVRRHSRWSRWANQPMQSVRLARRAIGLGLLAVMHREERPKVLVYRSRIAVLARSVVHILPASVTTALVYINLRGHFIGRDLEGSGTSDDIKMSTLQVASKVQELLIISSIGSIVLQTMTSQLLFGDGVPFGFLGSDKAYASVSFFWSTEFWGGLVAINPRRWRTSCLFVLLLLWGGLMALLAGPTTAILMIPRSLDWPIGGGIFWLNGTEEQLWPSTLDSSYVSTYNCTDDVARLTNYECPAASYMPLYAHLSKWWKFPDKSYSVVLQDPRMQKNMYVASKILTVKDTWVYTASIPAAHLQDAFVTFHRNAMILLLHGHRHEYPYPGLLDWAESKTFNLETNVPAVRVACMPHFPINIQDTEYNITFPRLRQFERFSDALLNKGPQVRLNVTGGIKRGLLKRGVAVANGSNIRLHPEAPALVSVPLDVYPGDAGSMALVFLKQLEDTRLAPVTCTIDARWSKAKTIIETSDMGAETLPEHHFVPPMTRNLVRTQLRDKGRGDVTAIDFHPKRSRDWSHMTIKSEWFNLLSPAVPDSVLASLSVKAFGLDAHPEPQLIFNKSETNVKPMKDRTLLERLVNLTNFPITRTPKADTYLVGVDLKSMEVTIAMFFADGLSRCGTQLHHGSWRLLPAWQYNQWHVMNEELARTLVRIGRPVESFTRPQVLDGLGATRMEMRALFHGYVMAPTSWSHYLSMVILLSHAVVAIVYTAWSVLYRPLATEAWDTVPELVALSQQSAPADADVLGNVSAGIRSLKTMGRVVKIENCRRDTAGLSDPDASEVTIGPGFELPGIGGKEELQLRVQASWHKRDGRTVPADREAYGILGRTVAKENIWRGLGRKYTQELQQQEGEHQRALRDEAAERARESLQSQRSEERASGSGSIP